MTEASPTARDLYAATAALKAATRARQQRATRLLLSARGLLAGTHSADLTADQRDLLQRLGHAFEVADQRDLEAAREARDELRAELRRKPPPIPAQAPADPHNPEPEPTHDRIPEPHRSIEPLPIPPSTPRAAYRIPTVIDRSPRSRSQRRASGRPRWR